RRFNGVVNYYRKFAHIAEEVAILTPTKKRFKWTNEMEKAYLTLKSKFVDSVVAHYDSSKPVEIYTDASNVAMGSVLVQDDKVVRVFSKALSDVEQRYSTTEREMLAIRRTLEKYRNI